MKTRFSVGAPEHYTGAPDYLAPRALLLLQPCDALFLCDSLPGLDATTRCAALQAMQKRAAFFAAAIGAFQRVAKFD